MSNKTVKSLQTIYDALNSVVIPRGNKTKEEHIEILDNNIQQFNNLLNEYQLILDDNFKKMISYDEKLKKARTNHSRDYHQKKVKKYKETILIILSRLQNTQQSIENFKKIKDKLQEIETKKEDTIEIKQEETTNA